MVRRKVAHRFGGVWTELKLKALTEYMDFYQKALKNRGFETWYVDAFAGTGDRHTELLKGGIFDGGGPIEQVEVILDGSARKALRIVPPFRHYVFVEKHHGRAKALLDLKTEFPFDITVRPGEANGEIRALFSAPPWADHTRSGRQRGVVFLDPYGMSVDWATLKALADTKRVDVWYLFPRKAVVQQLAHDIRSIDDAKRRKLAQIFGCDDWESEFYESRLPQRSMFDDLYADEPTKDRIASPEQISAFARKRLGTLFCYVSDPLPLIVKGSDFFELYCLSNNAAAISLIRKGVEHVMRKYKPASRRKSYP